MGAARAVVGESELAASLTRETLLRFDGAVDMQQIAVRALRLRPPA